MSLGPTFVKMADGKWYKNPVLYGHIAKWFICFDEDEPPELVISSSEQLSKKERWELIGRLLGNLGVIARILEHSTCGQRTFPPDYSHFQDAIHAFLQIRSPIDLENLMVKHDGVYEEIPEEEGTYCEF